MHLLPGEGTKDVRNGDEVGVGMGTASPGGIGAWQRLVGGLALFSAVAATLMGLYGLHLRIGGSGYGDAARPVLAQAGSVVSGDLEALFDTLANARAIRDAGTRGSVSQPGGAR